MTTGDATTATDVQGFATSILGRPLWPHQVELATSPARYRCICAGRQSGKSTALAVLALFEAATRRDTLTLLVSAGEVASRRLLEECASLATSSAVLRGSVLDESKSQLTLSNGSRILSVPASQRQIRGWPVDLLVLDEAGFIDPDIWRAAEPAIVARPGSRVFLSSSPWGGPDHFFRALWQRGIDRPDEQVAAWHWPSSISPLVDETLLVQIREREPAEYFEREFLARWTDESGAFFTEAELMNATADYELLAPRDVPTRTLGGRWAAPAVAGVDWGVQRDQNALVLLSALNPVDSDDRRWRAYIPWLRAEHGWPWSEFIDYIGDCAERYWIRALASETNGVGSYPTEDLGHRLARRGLDTAVSPVWTDARRKQAAFGKIKSLLQADRLVLPRHPDLLRQLRALEFELTAGGTVRISAPERGGAHDDLPMALAQAVSCFEPRLIHDLTHERLHSTASDDPDKWVTTGAGVRFPRRPLPWLNTGWMRYAAGKESGDGW